MTRSIDFSKYSSIKIGPEINVNILESIQSVPKNWLIIGGCNNILLPPNPPQIAMLGKNFDFIKMQNDGLHVGAATKGGKLLSFAKKHDLTGFEILQKLPGTIGGMVKMNAGLKSWEIFENIQKVHTDKGWIPKSQIQYGYRFAHIDGIVYEVVFEPKNGFNYELLKDFETMRANQPNEPSCGSCFKNPPNKSAGRLLEICGFRGLRLGNMAFSQKHANFLINLGDGTYEEAISLIYRAQESVLSKASILLEPEIRIIEDLLNKSE
jgi:UDP-N-acetylmuramate dehydrogenase